MARSELRFEGAESVFAFPSIAEKLCQEQLDSGRATFGCRTGRTERRSALQRSPHAAEAAVDATRSCMRRAMAQGDDAGRWRRAMVVLQTSPRLRTPALRAESVPWGGDGASANCRLPPPPHPQMLLAKTSCLKAAGRSGRGGCRVGSDSR